MNKCNAFQSHIKQKGGRVASSDFEDRHKVEDTFS